MPSRADVVLTTADSEVKMQARVYYSKPIHMYYSSCLEVTCHLLYGANCRIVRRRQEIGTLVLGYIHSSLRKNP
jgi:hypothetical protein